MDGDAQLPEKEEQELIIPESGETPKEESPTDPVKEKKMRIFSALHGFEEPEEKPKAEEPKEEPAAKKEKPKAEPKPKAEGDDVTINLKGVRVSARPKATQPPPTKTPTLSKEDVEEVVSRVMKPKEEPAREDPDEGLPEGVREEISTWKYGEEKGLADKGTAEKIRKYVKGRASLVERLARENKSDPDYELEQDREYREWMRENKPTLSESVKKKIERAQLTAEIEERAAKNSMGEVAKIKEELYRMRAEPLAAQTISTFEASITEEALPENIANAVKEKGGFEAIREEYEVEASIVEAVLNKVKRTAREFVNHQMGLVSFDGKNPYHDFLYRFVDSHANRILKDPKARVRDGQEFVHPYDNTGKTGWTFSQDDILDMLKRQAKAEINKRITSETDRINRILDRRSKTLAASQDKSADKGKEGGDDKSPYVKPSPSSSSSEKPKDKPKGLFSRTFGD